MVKRFSVILLAVCCLILPVSGNAAPAGIPAGAMYEAAFSPHGGALELILSTIKTAEKTIRVAAYSFTSKPVSEALLNAYKRGIDVKIVADAKSNTGKYSAVTFLANQGVPTRLNDRYSIHHHKFVVVDERTLETGSFNFSAAAETKNAENVLVLRGVPELAAQYTQEWERLWSESEPVEKKY